MKILIVSATAAELAPFLSRLVEDHPGNENPKKYFFRGMEITILVTGVGAVFTSYHLTKELRNDTYDFAINAGLAGSFDRKLKLGDVVHVKSDCFADLGAEDGDQFLSIEDLGMHDPNAIPFEDSFIHNNTDTKNNFLLSLPVCSGITVNTAHGNDESIRRLLRRLQPQIESMEGAAFLYVCRMENVPCFQIRAISNYVERRNRNAWNIPLAVERLSKTCIEILTAF